MRGGADRGDDALLGGDGATCVAVPHSSSRERASEYPRGGWLRWTSTWRATRVGDAPFVGREEELGRLGSWLEARPRPAAWV